MGASLCLQCTIPIYTSVARCQRLQDETAEARDLDLNLAGLSNIQSLLHLTDSFAKIGVQEQRVVLQATQLATVSNTIKHMIRIRAEVLLSAHPAVGMHANEISKDLETVLESLQQAVDSTTAMVLDRSSKKLTRIRTAKQYNATQLQAQINHYCRLLHQQGASELKSPVMRRDRLCCSVKRGRSGVCTHELRCSSEIQRQTL